LKGEVSFEEFQTINRFLTETEDFDEIGKRKKYRITFSDFSDSISKFNKRNNTKITPLTIETLYKVIDYDGGVIRQLSH